MPVLHTINTLADHCAALADCIRTLEQNDVVVFMEEAARELNISNLPVYQELVASQCDIYILPFEDNPPLREKQPKAVKHLSYDDFVDLCSRFPTIQNWY